MHNSMPIYILNVFASIKNVSDVLLNFVFATTSANVIYRYSSIIFEDADTRKLLIPFVLILFPFFVMFFFAAICENVTAERAARRKGKKSHNGWDTVMKITAVLVIGMLLGFVAVICEVGKFEVVYWIVVWSQIACFGLFFSEIFKEIDRNVYSVNGIGIPALKKIAYFMNIISTKAIINRCKSLSKEEKEHGES